MGSLILWPPLFPPLPSPASPSILSGCPRGEVSRAKLGAVYYAVWFDARQGAWQPAGNGTLRSSPIGIIIQPQLPTEAIRA